MTSSDLDPELPSNDPRLARRALLGGALAAGAATLACGSTPVRAEEPRQSGTPRTARKGYPVLVGSTNALAGMKLHYQKLLDGGDPLDVAIEVVKVTEADPLDDSVGLGGLPNEEGVVQLDAACMYGPRHKSGAVACIENILHPSEVARLVLERTDHCLLVGRGAYEFARKHGHPHTELLTEASRQKWLEWKESLSPADDWLPPPPKIPYQGALAPNPRSAPRQTGTIHCSALAKSGAIACTTTTSGLAWKIPGRVGDSAIVGAGLYCDQEVGSAGSTGRGEACVLANASFAIVELMRHGASPLDAGLELLRRVTKQTQRQSRFQPELVDERGLPSFDLQFYVLGLDGTVAGVRMRGEGKFAVSDPEKGPRLEPFTVLPA
ncbi:MAG TPA: isoaspartyl peptidase/L-asparaginase [Planctomycetota bacterium]|jgi:N4-(beta-N-acetylglucosaminyl)-L-asparaginase|nr:isoaspartyl peptidase/L-asparaginase [Planctomycetota bacterium]